MEVCDSDSDDELPPGWEERATFQGQVYYANHNTQETQWTHPRTKKRKYVPAKLPFGWVRELLPDGKILYVDHRTKRTTYSDPRLAFAVEQENKDFRQRFDASTRALQILHGLDLSDHIAVITGANSGIGFETARTLAFHGCTVIFACRNIIKAEIAIGLLANERPGIKCFALYCDLSSFQSVAEFSRNFNSEYTKLDVLILNAGVFGLPYSKTSDGYETMTQVNFLSHFYLSHLLRPSLIKASHPKIVAVSTESHRFSSLHKSDDIDPSLFSYKPSDFFSTQVYNNSKCMLLMAALEMDRRWQRMGIRVLAVHPGNCRQYEIVSFVVAVSRFI